ncbi:MAG: transposase [Chitinophagaceae bacterium]|nr:transposase [Chitinophagaceae bacterium]
MPDYHIPLRPGNTYHLFSRANGSEKIFLNSNNYAFFLQRLERHTSPIADLFAYNLLPNHFHLMMRMKQIETIEQYYKEVKKGKIFTVDAIPEFLMERFSNCLNSYTKAFNKMYNRKGALFMDYLRRVEIQSDEQFRQTVFYVHKNAVHHGLVKKISDWPYSSYHSILQSHTAFLNVKNVLDMFDGLPGFVAFHAQPIQLK